MKRAKWILLAMALTHPTACTWDSGASHSPRGEPNLGGGRFLAYAPYSISRAWEGERPNFWLAEPSPDGRHLTIGSNGGGFAVVDLTFGDTTVIRPGGDVRGRVETTTWSPDGTRIAFVYSTPLGREIRTIGSDGSDEKTVVPPTPGLGVKLEAWWNGHLLAHHTYRGSDEYQFVWIALEDGSFRTILQQPFSRAINLSRQLALSPDGRFIAYSEGREEEGDVDGVVIRAADGLEVSRFSGPAWEEPLTWTPDGDAVLVYVDRDSEAGIWEYPMSDGQPEGRPSQVMEGRATYVGAARDELFIGIMDLERVRVAKRDPSSGTLVSAPVALDADRPSDSPIWSASGNRLAYARGASGVRRTVVIRSFPDTVIYEISVPFGGVGLWTWEGSDVLLGTGVALEDGHMWAFELDLPSGRTTLLANLEEVIGVALDDLPPFAFDGEQVFFLGYEAGPLQDRESRSGQVIARDLNSRSSRVLGGLRNGTEVMRMFLSPDSELIALILRERATGATSLAITPTNEGGLREIGHFRSPVGISPWGGHWDPPTGAFFFAIQDEEAGHRQFWRLDYQEDRPSMSEVTLQQLLEVSEVSISPGGGWAAFVAGSPAAEMWALEMRASGGG